MNNSNRILKVLVVSLFFVCTTSFAQQTHYITLHVNTDQITSQNESEVSSFTSESPDTQLASDGNLEDFTTTVNAGDTVIWKGVSSNNPDYDIVNISSINWHGGDNVFDENVIKGNGDSPEEVAAAVKTGTNGQIEKYTIKFTVINNGNKKGGTYHIDPKIAVKP